MQTNTKAMEGQLVPSGRKSLIIFNVYLRSRHNDFFMKREQITGFHKQLAELAERYPDENQGMPW